MNELFLGLEDQKKITLGQHEESIESLFYKITIDTMNLQKRLFQF